MITSAAPITPISQLQPIFHLSFVTLLLPQMSPFAMLSITGRLGKPNQCVKGKNTLDKRLTVSDNPCILFPFPIQWKDLLWKHMDRMYIQDDCSL